MSILHILNGDSTARQLHQTTIPGKVAVWREMLCEGPCPEEVSGLKFWEVRSAFLQTYFGISAEAYQQQTRDELQLIQFFNTFREVVLWFEYDLFCQLNLLALCSFLKRHWRGKTRISLICTGNFPGREGLVGLGEIDRMHYPALFAARRPLSEAALAYAERCWAAYCSESPVALRALPEPDPGDFPYLGGALGAHFQRFPSAFNGLNGIEQHILEAIAADQLTPRQVIGHMLRWQQWFGFGDVQYAVHLRGLRRLYTSSNGYLELNDQGHALLEGRLDYLSVPQTPYYFGGARKQRYRYADGSLTEN